MKINNFRGELIDISAEKEALVPMERLCTSEAYGRNLYRPPEPWCIAHLFFPPSIYLTLSTCTISKYTRANVQSQDWVCVPEELEITDAPTQCTGIACFDLYMNLYINQFYPLAHALHLKFERRIVITRSSIARHHSEHRNNYSSNHRCILGGKNIWCVNDASPG